MPIFIPIILGAIALSGTSYGIKKGYDGVSSLAKANKINEESSKRYESRKEKLKANRNEVNTVIEDFGKSKLYVLDTTVKPFLDYLKQLNQKQKGRDLDILSSINLTQEELSKLSDLTFKAKSILESGIKSVFTSFGVQGGLVTLAKSIGVASTGTAIGGLSGAAATNALLAWFGGGSLATGGLGILGGTIVLGGVVVLTPLFTVIGYTLASDGEKALTQAFEYARKVEEEVSIMDLMQIILTSIERKVYELGNLIVWLKENADILINGLISTHPNDFNFDNKEHLASFQKSGLFVKAIQELINTPILNNEGNLTNESQNIVVKVEKIINSKDL